MMVGGKLVPLSVGNVVSFFVPGEPMAKGDHTIGRNKAGAAFLREKNAGRKASWRDHAADLARASRGDRPLFDGPVRVTMRVLRVRPLGHYGSGRNAGVLKPSAPKYPTSKPDLDKLQRSLGDALNGVVWRDDSQVTTWDARRRWGDEAGMLVVIRPEEDEED